MDSATKQKIPVPEASLFAGKDVWFDSAAGAYVWLRIFMLARDLGAKGRVCRMVYSGDINHEKSCSGPVWTRRLFSSGFTEAKAFLWSRLAGTTPRRPVSDGHHGETALKNMGFGYLECNESPSK
jgi:hypothetical protein